MQIGLSERDIQNRERLLAELDEHIEAQLTGHGFGWCDALHGD